MGHAGVDDFQRKLGEWLPTIDDFLLLLSGEMLLDAVHAKSLTAGGFDDWVWNDFRALFVGWFDCRRRHSYCVWEAMGHCHP